MSRTPLVDQIEAHGLALEQGLITSHEAADSLAECSNGGLTLVGAADMLGQWRSARTQYAQILASTRAALERLHRTLGESDGDA